MSHLVRVPVYGIAQELLAETRSFHEMEHLEYRLGSVRAMVRMGRWRWA